MSVSEHEDLLRLAGALEGSVMLCGYDNDLYRDLLPNWTIHEKNAAASGRGGGVMRRELLWSNERATAGCRQSELFS